MKKLLLLILIFFTLLTFSQKEANIWYFGRNAGIDFNTTPPTTITNGQLNTLEGCSSFSDANGNLLFYSDGTIVYDKNHQIMTYTDGALANNLKGNQSSTQSGMIIPKPGSSSIYYLFTVGDNRNSAFDLYTIDMALNDGNGQLIDEDGDGNFSKDLAEQAQEKQNWTEKVAAVRGTDCKTFWVVTKASDSFYSYKIDIDGVNLTPVISSVNNTTNIIRINTRGYLKISPNGKKIAVANQNTRNDLMLYSFNATTGMVANDGISIFNDFADGEAYGVEFSMSSKKLYVSSTSEFRETLNDPPTTYRLFQYDLTATNIQASKVKIHEQIGYRGALQLNPNGKIYATIPLAYNDTNGDATFLDVIENPNAAAADVIFTKNAISLGGQKSTQGLPPFISSILLPIEVTDTDTDQIVNNQNLQYCIGETKTITPETVTGNTITYEWIFDNGTTSSTITTAANLTLTNLTKADNGKYTLIVKLTDACNSLIQYEGTFNIGVFEVASATQPEDIIFCDTDRDGFNAFDLQTTKNEEILNNLDSTIFNVLYFNTLEDATANLTSTALPNPYTNPTPFSTQTIYARVHNKNAPNTCFAITDFKLIVNDLPNPTQPTPYRLCDDTASGSDTDGITNNFRLNTKDAEILGTLNATQYNISYHTSLAEAQNSSTTNPIDKTTDYRVTNSQRVYVRIENKDDLTCNVISNDATGSTFTSFQLIVTPLPVIKNPNPAEIRQCVINPNGLSTINLTVAKNNIADNLGGTFEYYEDQAATQKILNVTSYPVDANTSPPKSVWVKTISEFGCSRISELKLIIGIAFDETYDETFPKCDDLLDTDGNDTFGSNNDTDGITWFRLDKNAIVANINVNPNIDVFFFENTTDRDEFKNRIDISNYRNKNIPNTTGNKFPIYYKLINKINNDCVGVGQIYVRVDPSPTANPVIDLEECDDLDDGNGTNGIIQSFNLEQQTATILGNQNPANYTVTYHLTAAEAATGNNPLLSPFTNTTRDSQPIFVRVTNNTKDCFTSQTSFNVIVNPLPVAYPALDIEVCDDDSDGSARNGFSQIINLESRTATILGSQDPALFSVSYHASLTDAQNDSNPLLSPFSNTVANRQRIYVRVFNQTTQCANGISNFDVIIHPKPLANPDNTLSNLSLCDTNIDGDDTNGFVDDIDFSIQIPTILGTSQDPDDFNISFHANQADATSGNNPLSTKAYSNSARQETIFVRIKNIATGCVNDNLTFLLIIKELPRFSVTGNTPENPQILCLNYTTPHILVVENPAGMYQYQWTDKTGTVLGTDASLIITAAGEYTIKATDNTTTCSRQRTIYVKESEVATLNEGVVTIIDETNNIGSQNTISIAINTENLGKGDYQFAILNTDTNTRIPIIGFQDAPLFENLEGGIYTIIVNDKNGCVQDTILTISVIQFPKFFTPNGDGRNDTWTIKGANKTFYPNSSINIFNRYGKLVAQVPIDSQGWNGIYKGKNLPSDDYWYSVLLTPANSEKERISKKGHFSLLRE